MDDVGGTSRGHIKNSNRASLDVNKLAKSMRAELEILDPFSDECCIYRVPEELRELNEKAYAPRVVSIGPFHHNKAELKGMEKHKKMYLQAFLQWTKVRLEVLLKFIGDRETRLRNCYADPVECSSEDFVKMMFLDAVFVIWFLLAYSFPDIRTKNDRIFGKSQMINYVRFDICLLENQLPFFILEDLLNISAILNHREDLSMTKITHYFLKDVWGSWVAENILHTCISYKVEHFVDFLRVCQKPSSNHKGDRLRKLETLTTPSVTQLHQAGVKFKSMSMDGDFWNIHDMKFNIDEGILEIPRLNIVDSTEFLFRNLQAFEQCHCIIDGYVANYILIMDMLVHSAKDVEMLVQMGIIENKLGDNDAVSSLFHNLCKGVVFNRLFYFSGLVEDLNKYCRMRRHKWKAALKQNYFHNPWSIISVIAAGILLVLTVIQTLCSIIQVA